MPDAITYPTGQYVILHATNAGVFAGVLDAYDPTTRTAQLTDARRIWYWEGAASITELALRGVAHPTRCKIPGSASEIVTEIIELIPCTPAAETNLRAVPEWTAHTT